MDATTIDQLCTDVFDEIFGHLSGSDLKNCALVCKDWNETIGSSAVAMKKFRITFCFFALGEKRIFYLWEHRREIEMQNSDESCRKYQHVVISIYDGSQTQLPSLDRFNMSQVKTLSLQFTSSVSIELSRVMELLSRMPLLQLLEIYFGGCSTIDTSNTLAVGLPKLKQLKVQVDGETIESIKILEFIKANNVIELAYHAWGEHFDAEIDVMADFIKSNKSLATINITEDLLIQLYRRHDFSGMNLESLIAIAGFNLVSSTVIDNFSKSLICNAHSLTSLSIPSRLISKEILVVIFNRLRKLTFLEIDSVYDDDVDSWMNNLSPNDISNNLSLENLRLDRVGAIGGLKMILQRAPELKKLALRRGATGEILKEVASLASRLVELEINSLKEVLTCDQRFNELKSLTIDEFYSEHVDSLASMLERCPKIEVFECRFYNSEDPSSLIDILQQQKTLKHLRFNFKSAARQILFDRLKANYGNLRSLKFEHCRVDDKFILFNFPEKPAEWNVEQQEARFADFQAALTQIHNE